VRQSAEERQFNGLSLVAGQLYKRGPHSLLKLGKPNLVAGFRVGIRFSIERARGIGGIEWQLGAGASSKLVNAPVVHKAQQPANELATRMRKTLRLSPELEKDFLHYFFGHGHVTDDAQGEAVALANIAIVQLFECSRVLPSDSARKLFICRCRLFQHLFLRKLARSRRLLQSSTSKAGQVRTCPRASGASSSQCT